MGEILIDGQAALLREKNRDLEEKAGCVRKDEPPKRGVVGIGNAEMYARLSARVSEAEKKHPAFSDGIYQGVGVIGEEYGKMCRHCARRLVKIITELKNEKYSHVK